ncbi:DNA N-6-adenine-methyltransferase [Leptothoe spongobia]|uniref:Uncharacterized protein n=1 Tax=Leptothoe spongobia TAU-MAC 1115 TaxID=1967444 RepID=A0A947GKC8_9CYAN|nr:DNA N-6-adenine-methyltransferase [Leptothoe spongobia]MBT9316257.1 hypothetical protein [Leptothoe spongobia TAU-MAC 1115]
MAEATTLTKNESIETSVVLSPEQIETYLELKQVIQDKLDAFIDVGMALARIRQEKLYKADFGTWPDFCASFKSLRYPEGLSSGRADQLIRAAEASVLIEDIELPPLNEAILRELQKHDKENWKEITSLAKSVSDSTGHKITAPFIAAIAQEIEVAPFSELQEMYAPYGGIQRIFPKNTTERPFMYRTVDHPEKGSDAWFKTMLDAISWHQVNNLPAGAKLPREEAETQDDPVRGAGGPAGQTLEQIDRNSKLIDEINDSDASSGLESGVEPNKKANLWTTSANDEDDPGKERDERWTPEKYWLPALDMHSRAAFDLDPATCDGATVPARCRYTKENNGLLLPWDADLLWANWPYSENREWTDKFITEYERGAIATAFILDKTDNRTYWYQTLIRAADAYCLVDHGIRHLNTDGGAQFGSTIFYYGPDPVAFAKAYQHLGFIGQTLRLATDEQF